jgi:flagellar basal-body rod modification protein FlgD
MTDGIDATGQSGINQTDYLKLFMQELTYQDPLKPVDNREFMAQMAQFSSLQEARTTNESLSTLMGIAYANQNLMLLGKEVKIKDSDALGVVRKVEFKKVDFKEDATPILTIEINGALVEKQINDITAVL